jgi:hypothetical protein
MLGGFLLVIGLGIMLFCLWRFKRYTREMIQAAAAGPKRLEVLVEELIATAESTASLVSEKTEELEAYIQAADLRIASLRGEAILTEPKPQPGLKAGEPPLGAAGPEVQAQGVTAPNDQGSSPTVHRHVLALTAAGLPPAGIARELQISAGMVEMILSMRRSG